MSEWMKKIICAVWCHRAVYAGIAGAYGAACLGLDKELVNQVLTGLYVALVVQADH